MTNAEKFKEVFGREPDTESMAIACPLGSSWGGCEYQSEMGSCHCDAWWLDEYKERRE